MTQSKARKQENQISLFLAFGIARKQENYITASVMRSVASDHSVRGCKLANSQDDGPADNTAVEGENKTLNFKVSPDFKKEFKGFAGSQGITMTDLLKEGFALSKKQRQK